MTANASLVFDLKHPLGGHPFLHVEPCPDVPLPDANSARKSRLGTGLPDSFL
jgi:hypothetical protein